jgi:carbamoyltransferase
MTGQPAASLDPPRSVILGLNFGLHDSSASLLVDGLVVAAAEEERFSREKHTTRFPRHAIEYVVRQAGLGLRDVTDVAYYWNTQGRWGERLKHHAGQCVQRLHQPARLWRYLNGFVRSRRNDQAHEMMFPERALREHFPGAWGDFALQTLDHHRCHAASAYYPSGFERAAILIVDGSAELESTSLYLGSGGRIEPLDRQALPHSLGFFYGAATEYLGFQRNHDEYKVMGMAAYGSPTSLDTMRHIVRRTSGLGFRLDDRYFDQVYGGRYWYARSFVDTFGPPREPDAPVTQQHFDFAASVQARVEEVLVELARHALQRSGARNLCMAGGVALNCLANQRISEVLRAEGLLDGFYIHPAANDAGASLGAAFELYATRTGRAPLAQTSPYLGPEFSREEVLAALQRFPHLHAELQTDIESALADELHAGKVVCRFAGRMEWGPRALGNRSILASPARVGIRDEVNVKVKLREEFRPFAPACLAEDFDRFFQGDRNAFMLMVNRANELARQTVPAVVHFDGTARVQCVDATMNPRFHRLLAEFSKRSGFGVLLNTSFNIQEPIVCTPEQALATFSKSSMDCLALEDFLVRRSTPEDSPAIPPL